MNEDETGQHSQQQKEQQKEQHTEHQQKRVGFWMLVSMWLIVFGLVGYYFQSWLEQQSNPNQTVNTTAGQNGEQVVELKRNRYGHYVTAGTINNEPVVFMVDTGASDISVPASIAKRIGLKRGREVTYQTANGPAVNYATQLQQVAVGGIELNNVRASINPNVESDEILLGMTFLKSLEFSQQGDSLILRQY